MPTLYLIDGSAYIYRAFFALPPLTNAKGMPTNAVYGFTTTLLKIIREHHPDGLAVAFDEKGPTLRHQAFKDYKAQRPPMPEGMQVQIPYVHQVVEALGIPGVRASGYEADDLIGTLAHQAEQAGYDVVIVTGDKDMFQLLSPSVRIYDPVKDKWSGEAECRERFGVEPARVVDVMGLMGDSADNIPGVKGIGEKTAIKLITQFGTIENLLAHLDDVAAPKTRALLTEQAEQARLSRRLATIDRAAPIHFDAGAFAVTPPQADRLAPLLRELGFFTLLKAVQPVEAPADAVSFATETLADEANARRWTETIHAGDTVGVSVATGGESGVRASIVGMAFSTAGAKAVTASRLEAPLRDLLLNVGVLKGRSIAPGRRWRRPASIRWSPTIC
ncbi:MAG: hypothetical protein E8D45_12100 [Nitrospira sp.]|nr:MAG: hypothetical protein E8D45_12100 [Nitrospira sp.]